MQPKTPSTIHINPKFRNIHINPMFLNNALTASNQTPSASQALLPVPAKSAKTTNIYINPRFLNDPNILAGIGLSAVADDDNSDMSTEHSDGDRNEEPEMVVAQIQTQINRKLIRTPLINPPLESATASRSNLMKIGSRKLIRAPVARSKLQHIAISKVIRKPIQTKYKIVKEHSTYKIDRRTVNAKLSVMLSLNREFVQHRLLKIRSDRTKQSQTNGSRSISKPFANRKLARISINGIAYRSTNMKLQKTTSERIAPALPTSSKGSQSHRILYVRGEKFLLEPNGQCLLRSSTSTLVRTTTNVGDRIHIGGLTYVRSANNTYELTDYHMNRFHLSLAKQRSISLLSPKMTKMNVPCPIYRKLGKCMAFTRSRCVKLHDPKLVDICPRFLKGSCDKSDCLLYHKITLAKMPTCRYYLQGLCVKTDCLFLHKKVNENAGICTDFLRGYCELATKCPKRHDMLCPEFQRNGECKVTRCPYPHPRRRRTKIDQKEERRKELSSSGNVAVQTKPKTATTAGTSAKVSRVVRYFIEDREGAQDMDVTELDDQQSGSVELSAENKAKLSRVLNKIEQMKVNYLLGTSHSSNGQPVVQSLTSTSEDSQTKTNDDDATEVDGRKMRPKLGPLPSFIPLD